MKEWFVPLLTHMQLLANHGTCSCCNLVFRRSQASLWDINGRPKEAPLPSCSVSAKKWLQSEFISSDSALKGSMDTWIAKLDDFDADEVTRQSWRPHFLLQMKFSTNVQYFLPEACYVFTKGQSISSKYNRSTSPWSGWQHNQIHLSIVTTSCHLTTSDPPQWLQIQA